MADVPRVGNGGLGDMSGSSSATFTGTWACCVTSMMTLTE